MEVFEAEGRNGTILVFNFYTVCQMIWYFLRVDWNKLKMYSIKTNNCQKAQQRFIANKPTKEIQWNH